MSDDLKVVEANLDIVPTQNEANMILINKFAFQKIRTSSKGITYWRCREYRSKQHKCKCTCMTSGFELVIRQSSKTSNNEETTSQHNHDPLSDIDIAMMKAHGNTKKRAREELDTNIHDIFDQEFEKAVGTTNLLGDFIPFDSFSNFVFKSNLFKDFNFIIRFL